MRRVGLEVRRHDDEFHEETPDVVWLEECGKRGWSVITSDQDLVDDNDQWKVAVRNNVKIFMTTDNSTRGIFWAASVVGGRNRMIQWATQKPGPFLVRIRQLGEMHISRPFSLKQRRPRKPAPGE
jgi:hypothetical protein